MAPSLIPCDEAVCGAIREVLQGTEKPIGCTKLTAEVRKRHLGWCVNPKRVRRLMRRVDTDGAKPGRGSRSGGGDGGGEDDADTDGETDPEAEAEAVESDAAEINVSPTATGSGSLSFVELQPPPKPLTSAFAGKVLQDADATPDGGEEEDEGFELISRAEAEAESGGHDGGGGGGKGDCAVM